MNCLCVCLAYMLGFAIGCTCKGESSSCVSQSEQRCWSPNTVVGPSSEAGAVLGQSSWRRWLHSLHFLPHLTSFLLLSIMSCSIEYPFGQLRSAVLTVPLLHLLPTLSLLAFGGSWGELE